MTISNEAVEKAADALREYDDQVVRGIAPEYARAARTILEAAAPIIRAECLEEAARDLAQLPYVKPDQPGRAEYESVLAVRRGNTDGWLLARAKAERGRQ